MCVHPLYYHGWGTNSVVPIIYIMRKVFGKHFRAISVNLV